MPLWIVATPIGTLDDCSPRARKVLAEANLIAAEDTRVTRKLLGALGIAPPRIVSVRAKNERSQVDRLLREASEGDLVYVCDAGTPGISDPGALLVAAALEAEVQVLSVPGPSAFPTALAAAGFSAVPSFFAGFAPKKGRENWLKGLLQRSETLVVFEAPGRIVDLVRRCAAIQPDRSAALCRELSKRHEEILRGPLCELLPILDEHKMLKGEMVLVVGPWERAAPRVQPTLENDSHKALSKALAARWGVTKREAYQELTRLDTKYNPAD